MRKNRSLCKYLRNERGISLLVVLMVVVVISIMGLGLMGMAINNVKMSSSERNQQSAYYIAEAGATKVLSEISKGITEVYNETSCSPAFYSKAEQKLRIGTDIIYDSFEKTFGETPEAKINIKRYGNIEDYTYKLVSEGKIGTRSRTVESTFSLTCQEEKSNVPIEILSDLAVFSNGKMNLISTVTGNIGTNSTNSGSIFIDWGMANYKGVINLVPSADSKIVNTAYTMNGFKPSYNSMAGARNYTLPAFPDYPEVLPLYPSILLNGNMKKTIHLNEDRSYNEIKLTANTTLTLHFDEDRKIRVKKLDMPQGHIILTGKGKLTLYIEDDLSMSGGSSINKNEASDKLSIYYKGKNEITLANDIKINGSIYTKSSDIYLGGSGAVTGHILSGGSKITVDGGSNLNSRVILAPQAFVHVKNGTVNGSIICDTFTIEGGGKVNYEQFGEDELIPFYPPTEGSGNGGLESNIKIEPIREKS